MGYINLVYFICCRKVIYLILIIFIFMTLNLYARGHKEERIPDAMVLVEERRYNDAILLLTEIMKTSPDQFAEAQKLIQKISIARGRYNTLYEELIRILNPPPGAAIDEDRAYTVIREMEDLDSDPNKASVAAFGQARKSIVFAVENRTYSIIMDTAADHISRKEYLEAIETYLEGFNLHIDGFAEENYGNIVEDQVKIYQDTIRTATGEFENFYDILLDAPKIYSDIIRNKSVQGIEKAYFDYSAVMLEASAYWKILKSTAAKLDNLRLSAQRESESDIPYISTNRVLTVGRSLLKGEEGIAGVLSHVWDNGQELIISMLISLLEDTYREAVNNYEASFFNNSRNIFSETARLSVVAVNVLKLRGNMLYLDSKLEFKDTGPERIHAELPDLIFAQTVSETADLYTNLSFITEEVSGLSKTIETAGSINIIKEAQVGLEKVWKVFDDNETILTVFIAEQSQVEDSTLDLTKTSESLAKLQNNLEILDNNIFIAKVRSKERILILEIEPERLKIVNSAKNIIASAAYIDGVEELINGLPLKVKRPDMAEQLLLQTEMELEDANLAITKFVKRSEEDNDAAVKSNTSILFQLSAAENLKSDILLKKQEIDRLLLNAKVLSDEADDAYSFGILRLDETYEKFDRDDFDGARKKYYEAESLFLKSLEYREDAKIRNLLTIELAGLDSDIKSSLNRKVILEVRQFINKGKDYYNLQEFIKAEQSFQQAEARYSVTNDKGNPEIANWLIKITRALEATSGREIAITDPLYSDIIAILNLAGEAFEKGKAYLKTGSKEEADIHFNEAIKNIELVKTPFPRNFKASVMYLEILEYTQAEAFKNFFQSMYNTAVKYIGNDPKRADDDILALYEINSDFPGIKSAVYRSGVASGRIIPPPAQVDIKRATQLYSQAKTIMDADSRAQFPIALAYLEEAIQINSDYNAAAVLMDRIRTSTGGVSQVEMIVSDTQKLRYAESLYIDGRYLEANIIINQLWINTNNRKSSKLNDLRIKVEARL